MLREIYEETGLKCKFVKFNCVDQVLIKKENKSYIGIFSTLKSNSEKCIESNEGKLKWFNLDLLPKKMVKVDKYLIENYLNQKIKIPTFVYQGKKFEILI